MFRLTQRVPGGGTLKKEEEKQKKREEEKQQKREEGKQKKKGKPIYPVVSCTFLRSKMYFTALKMIFS